jgi:hypothetical protein
VDLSESQMDFFKVIVAIILFNTLNYSQNVEDVIRVKTNIVRVPIIIETETRQFVLSAHVNNKEVNIENLTEPSRKNLKCVVIHISSGKKNITNYEHILEKIQETSLNISAWVEVGGQVEDSFLHSWEKYHVEDIEEGYRLSEEIFKKSGMERQSLLIISDTIKSLTQDVWEKFNPSLPSSGRMVTLFSLNIPQKKADRRGYIIYRSNLQGRSVTLTNSLSDQEYIKNQVEIWCDTVKTLYVASFYLPDSITDSISAVQVEVRANGKSVAQQVRNLYLSKD